MREIVFRGKRINGEWAEGWYYKRILWPDNVVDAIMIYDGENLSSVEYHAVFPETLGQFTGLTDRNGVGIFEGDIIRLRCGNYENVGKVIYSEDNARFGIIDRQGEINFSFLHKHFVKQYAIKVIGNIHDTPELLKEDDHA